VTREPVYPFRSELAKAEYEAHSRERAKAWPVPYETMLLDTPSGQTFVRASGRVTDPLLVLLPGARVGSLMWIDSIAALSARYRTYALDIIGDAGFWLLRPLHTGRSSGEGVDHSRCWTRLDYRESRSGDKKGAGVLGRTGRSGGEEGG
jgi:hypothetical protein